MTVTIETAETFSCWALERMAERPYLAQILRWLLKDGPLTLDELIERRAAACATDPEIPLEFLPGTAADTVVCNLGASLGMCAYRDGRFHLTEDDHVRLAVQMYDRLAGHIERQVPAA